MVKVQAYACRKAKAAMLETGLPRLEKLSKRGKHLTKEITDDRLQKVSTNLGMESFPHYCSSGNRTPNKM